LRPTSQKDFCNNICQEQKSIGIFDQTTGNGSYRAPLCVPETSHGDFRVKEQKIISA
jgi:hypothetical protein